MIGPEAGRYIAPPRGGAIAQLGERLNGIQEVRGSTPLGSTNDFKALGRPRQRFVTERLLWGFEGASARQRQYATASDGSDVLVAMMTAECGG